MKENRLDYNVIIFIILLMILTTTKMRGQRFIGDAGVTFDNSKNDINYPFMREWQKAGVEGGIPLRNTLPIKITLAPTDSKGIQDAINLIDTGGKPSVILLKEGTYTIDQPIQLKSNVILRGESKNQVVLEVIVRSNGSNNKQVITFDDVRKSGLEDLTFEYIPNKSIILYDDRNVPLNRFCGSRCFGNDPEGEKNMYVSFVRMKENSKNCWIDNCVFKNSGSDPLEIWGNHITCRNNFIDACYNKGGGGNGYYDIRGDYNLFAYEKVRRIRHFTIQQKAKYNVVTQCEIEVDVNFHNGDRGFNLVENNRITSLQWRSWGAFASGGSKYGHDKPGPNNIIFNNITKGRGNSEQFGGNDKVFVFDQYSKPRVLKNAPPSGNTFYPVVLNGNGGDNGEGCEEILEITASQDAYLQGDTSFNTTSLRVEKERRISYLQFEIPEDITDITGVVLEMSVSNDSGNGLIEVYKGNSNDWTETNLSTGNKPEEMGKLGSLDTSYGLGQSYQWELSGVTPGEIIALVVKQIDGNDVSFSSKESNHPPKLIVELECGRQHEPISQRFVDLKISPNPTNDFLTVSGVESGETIMLYDFLGNILKSIISKGEEDRLDLSEIPSGQYVIKAIGNSLILIKE